MPETNRRIKLKTSRCTIVRSSAIRTRDRKTNKGELYRSLRQHPYKQFFLWMLQYIFVVVPHAKSAEKWVFSDIRLFFFRVEWGKPHFRLCLFSELIGRCVDQWERLRCWCWDHVGCELCVTAARKLQILADEGLRILDWFCLTGYRICRHKKQGFKGAYFLSNCSRNHLFLLERLTPELVAFGSCFVDHTIVLMFFRRRLAKSRNIGPRLLAFSGLPLFFSVLWAEVRRVLP